MPHPNAGNPFSTWSSFSHTFPQMSATTFQTSDTLTPTFA